MTTRVYLNTHRSGYTPLQCKDTATIGELIEALQNIASEYGEDVEVFYKNDNGYTYGEISIEAYYDESDIEVSENETDEDWR